MSSFCNPTLKKTNKNQMTDLVKYLDEDDKKKLDSNKFSAS